MLRTIAAVLALGLLALVNPPTFGAEDTPLFNQ